jgi:hypothetical protein
VNQAGETVFEVKNEKGEILKSWNENPIQGVNSTSWEYGDIVKGKYSILIKKNSGTDELMFEIK